METVRFAHAMEKSVRQLHAGSFALVMATGIVSIAAHLLGMSPVARIPFLINIPLYAILIGLSVARILLYPRQMGRELTSHRMGPAVLTTVAGSGIGRRLVETDNT